MSLSFITTISFFLYLEINNAPFDDKNVIITCELLCDEAFMI